MRLRLLVSLSLLPLTWPAACAQPADEFFHAGAQSYLTNNIARAREEVDNGLKIYPDDIKLKKLDELLKQQSQQQSKNDQQKQDQEQKDQQQQAKQDQKDQQKKQGEKPSQEQKDKQKQEQQAKSSGEKKDEEKQGEPSQPMQAHAMTPKEAQQLLDAQKGEEQFLQFKPAERTERPARPIKDW
jgi:hypothetical protein